MGQPCIINSPRKILKFSGRQPIYTAVLKPSPNKWKNRIPQCLRNSLYEKNNDLDSEGEVKTSMDGMSWSWQTHQPTVTSQMIDFQNYTNTLKAGRSNQGRPFPVSDSLLKGWRRITKTTILQNVPHNMSPLMTPETESCQMQKQELRVFPPRCKCVAYAYWVLLWRHDWRLIPAHSECWRRSLTLGSNPSSQSLDSGQDAQSRISCLLSASQK